MFYIKARYQNQINYFFRRKVPGDLGYQEYVSSGVQYTINKQ